MTFFLYVLSTTLGRYGSESTTLARKSVCYFDAFSSSFELCETTPSTIDQVLAFIYDWQTLVAGAIAFFPSAIAVFFVWRQSNDQRRQFLQLHEQEMQKARLRLGGNLSRVSQNLDAFFDKAIAEDFSYDQHHFASELIESVLAVAAISSGKTFANIRDFVALSQQYTAKCALYASNPNDTLLATIYRDMAVLDIMVDNMYPFARFEKDDISEPETDPKTIVRQLNVNLRRNKSIKGTKLQTLLQDPQNFHLSTA